MVGSNTEIAEVAEGTEEGLVALREFVDLLVHHQSEQTSTALR